LTSIPSAIYAQYVILVKTAKIHTSGASLIWQIKASGLMSMCARYRESIDRCAKPVTDGRKKMAEGFIKLHRSIKDCWLWKDDEPFSKRDAWIDLLLLANYTDKKILLD
jgi:hypothetical protein